MMEGFARSRPPRAGRRPWARYGPTRRRFNAGLVGLLLGIAAAGGIGAAEAAPIKLMALGDSLTAGFGLAPEDGFANQLQRALRRGGRDVLVQNAGVSGDTSAGGLARLDWALADKPAVAMVALGANDALRGIDPRQTFDNLDRILTRLKAAGIPTLLVGMLAPPNLGREYGAAFAAVFPRLAEKHGVALYPFFLDGVAAEPKLNQPDGIHPNATGVGVLVERLLPSVERLLTGG